MLFSFLFKKKEKLLKRPMIFETEDFLELENFYYERIEALREAELNTSKYKPIFDLLLEDFKTDEEILRFRKKNPEQWLKLSTRAEFKRKKTTQQALEKFEKQKPDVPQKLIEPTRVEIINRDLLPGPTEPDGDADELDEG